MTNRVKRYRAPFYVTGGIWGSEYAWFDVYGEVQRTFVDPPWLLLVDFGLIGVALVVHGARDVVEARMRRESSGPWPVAMLQWPRELDVERLNQLLAHGTDCTMFLAEQGIDRAAMFARPERFR